MLGPCGGQRPGAECISQMTELIHGRSGGGRRDEPFLPRSRRLFGKARRACGGERTSRGGEAGTGCVETGRSARHPVAHVGGGN